MVIWGVAVFTGTNPFTVTALSVREFELTNDQPAKIVYLDTPTGKKFTSFHTR